LFRAKGASQADVGRQLTFARILLGRHFQLFQHNRPKAVNVLTRALGCVLFSARPVTGSAGQYWGLLGDGDDLVSQMDEESNARQQASLDQNEGAD
jgi:hypothetical protein